MRTEATPARIAKLPAWARTERIAFERRIRALEGEVAALRAEPGALDDSPYDIHAAVLDPYGNKVPIGDGHVRYRLPPGEHRSERYVDARYVTTRLHGNHDVVELMGSNSLVIRAVASNVIVVETTDD